MAKIRTKAQKRRAAELHRLQAQSQNPAEVQLVAPIVKAPLSPIAKTGLQWPGGQSSSAAKITSNPKLSVSNQNFFGFSPRWIYADLRKTAVVSCLIVGILVFIYFLSF